ncbi:MAG: AtpZ/AtpI family protein [Hyphomicrobiales bacterium]|nr:AtpZ/AtpI family protein [Hyphomicrobiales bacterium]
MNDENHEESLRTRLDNLTKTLDADREASQKAAVDSIASQADARGLNLASRFLSEFMGAVLLGGLAGWAIDKWLHSSPFGLIIMLVLGFVAGIWNIYRMAAARSN